MYENKIMELRNYSSEEVSDLEYIISIPKFRSEVIKLWNNLFYTFYGNDKKRWVKKINEKGQEYYGLTETINGEVYWAHINRGNTNYTMLTHFKNEINNLLIRDNISDKIIFNDDYYQNFNNIRKMFKYAEKYLEHLISDKNEFYWELREYAFRIWKSGQEHTNNWRKNWKKYLPESFAIEMNDELPGDPVDMFYGFDCIMYVPSKKTGETIKCGTQIKGVYKCEKNENDNCYYVRVSMPIENYSNVLLFVFYVPRTNKIHIFKNDSKSIEKVFEYKRPVFKFPSKLHVNTLERLD